MHDVARAFRIYCQGELESMVRQMRDEGASIEDCEAELRVLADFVQAKADSLKSEAILDELVEDAQKNDMGYSPKAGSDGDV